MYTRNIAPEWQLSKINQNYKACAGMTSIPSFPGGNIATEWHPIQIEITSTNLLKYLIRGIKLHPEWVRNIAPEWGRKIAPEYTL